MPSIAATQFSEQISKPRVLAKLGQDARLRPIPEADTQACYHAALAAYVAAWDTYVKKLPVNFLAEISDPALAKFYALQMLVDGKLQVALKKFNTPNWDNSRELLRSHTGYEPINDWIWPRRQMNSVAVKDRLDEILKVRHSFAHGSLMPSYTWNTSPSGQARLTMKILGDVESFFLNLVKRTDAGMSSYIKTTFGVDPGW